MPVELPCPFAGNPTGIFYIDINAVGRRECNGTNLCIWPGRRGSFGKTKPEKFSLRLLFFQRADWQRTDTILSGMGMELTGITSYSDGREKRKSSMAHRNHASGRLYGRTW